MIWVISLLSFPYTSLFSFPHLSLLPRSYAGHCVIEFRISQPWHCWHLPLLNCGWVWWSPVHHRMCSSSLTSSTRFQEQPLSSYNNEKVSKDAQTSERQKLPEVENHCCSIKFPGLYIQINIFSFFFYFVCVIHMGEPVYIHVPVLVLMSTTGQCLLSISTNSPPYFLRYGLSLNPRLTDSVACCLMNSRSSPVSVSLDLGLQMGVVVPGFCLFGIVVVFFFNVGTWDPSSDPHVVSHLPTKPSPQCWWICFLIISLILSMPFLNLLIRNGFMVENEFSSKDRMRINTGTFQVGPSESLINAIPVFTMLCTVV